MKNITSRKLPEYPVSYVSLASMEVQNIFVNFDSFKGADILYQYSEEIPRNYNAKHASLNTLVNLFKTPCLTFIITP